MFINDMLNIIKITPLIEPELINIWQIGVILYNPKMKTDMKKVAFAILIFLVIIVRKYQIVLTR